MDGKGKGVIVDQWKEALRSMPALVTQVNPSSVLVKMENGEVTFTLFPESFVIIFEIQVGLQILEEDTMMTKEPRDWATIDPSIGIGDKVRKRCFRLSFSLPISQVTVHALLMDPSKRAPYLCTAVWRTGQTQPQASEEISNRLFRSCVSGSSGKALARSH